MKAQQAKSKKNHARSGHLLAAFTVGVWGMTFISTKVLLKDFTPLQILFTRFLLGYIFLWLIRPKRLKETTKQQEFFFALAGLSGITLYYFIENMALTYTTASNVGVVVSLAPFFTALLSKWVVGGKEVGGYFYIGFAVALSGIALISFGGLSEVALHPFGDFLGILAAFVWALYSLLSKKISTFGHDLLLATRRTFFYGLIFMLPLFLITGSPLPSSTAWTGMQLFHLLFLGIGASAICFITWNYSVKSLGAVKASVYIYAVPSITVVTSALFLNEAFTPVVATGTLLTTMGLLLSERSSGKEKEAEVD